MKYLRRRRLLAGMGAGMGAGAGLAAVGGLAWAQQAAQADNYPERSITLIVPFAPGGIADITARAVAEAMSRSLKQPVVVDNRPSAGSIVASAAVAKAEPDGYTMLLMSHGNAVSAGLFRKLPFDAVRDFAPISMLGVFDLGVFVAADSRWRELRGLMAHARAQPGRLSIGTITVGSTQHLAAELFKTTAGIQAVVVPYKSTPAVLTALRAGEIDVAFEILGPWLPQVAARTVRALAITSDRRSSALEDVPTLQEAGVANYNVASWNALAAPAHTPPAVVARLNAAANQALESTAVKERLRELGVRPQGGTPEQLQALLVSEMKRWDAVIRAAGIQPE